MEGLTFQFQSSSHIKSTIEKQGFFLSVTAFITLDILGLIFILPFPSFLFRV